MERELLTIVKGIEKILIFLAPKPFLIRTDCKGLLGFINKNLSNMQVQGRLLRWQLWLKQFTFDREHINGNKSSLADTLTRELADGIHIHKTYTAREGNTPSRNSRSARLGDTRQC